MLPSPSLRAGGPIPFHSFPAHISSKEKTICCQEQEAKKATVLLNTKDQKAKVLSLQPNELPFPTSPAFSDIYPAPGCLRNPPSFVIPQILCPSLQREHYWHPRSTGQGCPLLHPDPYEHLQTVLRAAVQNKDVLEQCKRCWINREMGCGMKKVGSNLRC